MSSANHKLPCQEYRPLPAFRVLAAFALSFCWASLSSGEEYERVNEEIQRLKQENAELRTRLESQAKAIERLIERLESLEAQAAPPEAMKGEVAEMEPAAQPSLHSTRRLNLQWFGDINFREGGKVRDGDDAANTFSLGQLDLMANSRLSDNMSVLAEVTFQYKDDESSSATIERLQLQYQANDLFNFRLGRMHTPFGYWNETYHHGSWFQTTVLRPEILRFHDGGSVLPIHSVGLEIYGYEPMEPLDFYYNFGVANGRGKSYTDTLNSQDLNSNKAVYAVFSLAPAAVPGLRFGANAYGDVIPPDSGNPARTGKIDEIIGGAHLVYFRDNLELLSEAVRIQHDDATSAQRFTTWGMYIQAGYQYDAVKPYYRYDKLDVAEGDPFYGPQLVDITRHAVGLRWDFINWAALKFEYHYIDQATLDSPHALYMQAAFTF